VGENKAKTMCKCAKRAPQQVLKCRQQTIKKKVSSNKLQCEINFHAEANSQTKRKI